MRSRMHVCISSCYDLWSFSQLECSSILIVDFQNATPRKYMVQFHPVTELNMSTRYMLYTLYYTYKSTGFRFRDIVLVDLLDLKHAFQGT